MARNPINAEMEARKGRRRVQELVALGMRNEKALTLTAIEFCVQEQTVLKWRCSSDDPSLNEAIAEREAQEKQIWDMHYLLGKLKSDGGSKARQRKVAQDKPFENQRTGEKNKQGKLF